jgi:hypothetical protein
VDPQHFSRGPGGEASSGPPESAGDAPPRDAPEGFREPEKGEVMARFPRSRPKPRAARKALQAKARTAATAPQPAGRTVRVGEDTKIASPRRHVSFPESEEPPGLQRLALDGALEAAKLPFKVGSEITFRALDAIFRSLRRD